MIFLNFYLSFSDITDLGSAIKCFYDQYFSGLEPPALFLNTRFFALCAVLIIGSFPHIGTTNKIITALRINVGKKHPQADYTELSSGGKGDSAFE